MVVSRRRSVFQSRLVLPESSTNRNNFVCQTSSGNFSLPHRTGAQCLVLGEKATFVTNALAIHYRESVPLNR